MTKLNAHKKLIRKTYMPYIQFSHTANLFIEVNDVTAPTSWKCGISQLSLIHAALSAKNTMPIKDSLVHADFDDDVRELQKAMDRG